MREYRETERERIEGKERVVGMRGQTTVRHNYRQTQAHACLHTGRQTSLNIIVFIQPNRGRLGDGVDKVVVLQCAVKYDIVGDGRAVELFRINEDTGVITLTQPFTIDDAILYKV